MGPRVIVTPWANGNGGKIGAGAGEGLGIERQRCHKSTWEYIR